MNPETIILTILNEALNALTDSSLYKLADALIAGTATDEQLAEFTTLAHGQFDEHLGCMVDAVIDMAEHGVPHYAINHAIRTYVRKNDKREQEAVQRDASLNARYGKTAQQ